MTVAGEHEHDRRESSESDEGAARVRVGVVVPTDDRAGLVLATIGSALRQTRPPREIVVVAYVRLRRWHAPRVRRPLEATLAAGEWSRARR